MVQTLEREGMVKGVLVCCNTPIAETLANYFEGRTSYQETVAMLHILKADINIIRALPQGTLELQEAS